MTTKRKYRKSYPTKAQLKQLEAAGWIKGSRGLYWRDPVSGYHYSPRRAVVKAGIVRGLV